MQTLIYAVSGISCEHCRRAISGEVTRIAGVSAVDVDLQDKLVTVTGDDLDDRAVRAAIDEAGYDID